MGPECHDCTVHFSPSQHTGQTALPNEQRQRNVLIFTVYSTSGVLHLSKEKRAEVWAGWQTSPGMGTGWLQVASPGICWQQRNNELRNLTVLQILRAVMGLSPSPDSTCCSSACFHPGLSLPPPWPLRPPQASSAHLLGADLRVLGSMDISPNPACAGHPIHPPRISSLSSLHFLTPSLPRHSWSHPLPI